MKLQERKKCAIKHTADLERLYTFRDFPVFMGCTQQNPQDDIMADMAWLISRSSGLIQLEKLLPLEILYPESHGSGCVGALWSRHHHSFAKFIEQFDPRGVLEIGGAHGILSKLYHEHSAVEWVIVEPNPTPEEGVRARFIKDFFDESFQFDGYYDAVVHSHVFEHIYDPYIFMAHLSSFMEEEKLLVFSIPNMQVMLERKYTNCINFEHTVFLTEPYVEYLLAKHGFSLKQKEYFMDDHSIFYAAIRDKTVKPVELSKGLYESNKKLYIDYVNYHKTLVVELNDKIAQALGPVYLFGAHVFAQYLIGFGLKTENIECILDNDPNKQGKRLYGTHLQVVSPKVLHGVKNANVILKAGVYNDEIKREILTSINSSIKFWE